MNQSNFVLFEILMKIFWILVASVVPALMLARDYGTSVGVAFFVLAGALMSIHYDVQDILKVVKKSVETDQS